MSYSTPPGAWSDPASGAPYVDPATGQPAYPAYQAGYPAQESYAGYGYAAPAMVPQQRGTNGMAIASLVLSLCGILTCGVTSLIGAILGHVARKQIRERGDDGDGLALGGVISGWVILALNVLTAAGLVIWFYWVYKTVSNYPDPYTTY